MTRWVRSGSTQKHKKMPGDATKWGEFDNQYGNKLTKEVKTNEVTQDSKQEPVNQITPIEQKTYDLNQRKSKKIKSENDSDQLKQENLSHPRKISASSNEICSAQKSFFNQDSHSKKLEKKKKLKFVNMKTESEDIFNDKAETLAQNETSFVTEQSQLENYSIKKQKKKRKKSLNQCSQEGESGNLIFNGKTVGTSASEESFLQKELMQVNTTPFKKKKKMMIELNQCSQDSESKKLLIDHENSQISASQNEESSEKVLDKPINVLNKKERKQLKKMKHVKEMVIPCSLDSESKKLLIDHENSQIPASQNEESSEKVLDKPNTGLNRKERKKLKKMKHEEMKDMVNSSVDNIVESSPAKKHEKNKERQLQRLRKKREAQGILLLPPKVEQKLYRIKKALREKGIPPHVQRGIIRKERRKAELDYRKIINPSKLCFNCREPGHVFADCPKKSESMKQETGICFKCGSHEHVSFKCPEKIQGFPLAKCFICKEQGHISRDCPRNKHGVYPKGGRCNICGNVNHLKKDCPSLKKQKEELESDVTLQMLSENTSIDAEIVPKEDLQKKCVKKPKIVKF